MGGQGRGCLGAEKKKPWVSCPSRPLHRSNYLTTLTPRLPPRTAITISLSCIYCLAFEAITMIVWMWTWACVHAWMYDCNRIMAEMIDVIQTFPVSGFDAFVWTMIASTWHPAIHELSHQQAAHARVSYSYMLRMSSYHSEFKSVIAITAVFFSSFI